MQTLMAAGQYPVLMAEARGTRHVFPAGATIEGAGVHLWRAFGYSQVPLFDPFLMLDDFRSERPDEYLAGFPWHPHRGIETVTYMLEGTIEHGDSLGNAGSIGAGDVQWMTAGSGIIHQEMPQPVAGRMGGFQLWVNLPRARKMDPPRYQEIPSRQVPVVSPQEGVRVRVICGTCGGVTGPVKDIAVRPGYFDVTLEPGIPWEFPLPPGDCAAAYVFGGSGTMDPASGRTVRNRDMVLFSGDGAVQVRSSQEGLRFLLLHGRPIREPVAWGGPVVMNTQEELRTAFREYRDGTFIRGHPR